MVSSKKPSKQRKSAFNAPLHVRRKRIRARLLTDDERFVGIRTVSVRVGDTVKVVRGDFGHPSKGKRHGDKRGPSGIEAKVIRIDSSSSSIFVEGVTRAKADNKEEGVPIHASNVVVTELDESDKLRMQKLFKIGEE